MRRAEGAAAATITTGPSGDAVGFLEESWLLGTRHPIRELDALRVEHLALLREWVRARETREALQGVYAGEDAGRRAAMLAVAQGGGDVAAAAGAVEVTAPLVREVTLQAAGEREMAAVSAVCDFALRCRADLDAHRPEVMGVTQLRLSQLHAAQVRHQSAVGVEHAFQDQVTVNVVYDRMEAVRDEVRSVRAGLGDALEAIVTSGAGARGAVA